MAVDPYNKYSNEPERANKDIYEKKLKKPLVSMVFKNMFNRFKGQGIRSYTYLTKDDQAY